MFSPAVQCLDKDQGCVGCGRARTQETLELFFAFSEWDMIHGAPLLSKPKVEARYICTKTPKIVYIAFCALPSTASNPTVVGSNGSYDVKSRTSPPQPSTHVRCGVNLSTYVFPVSLVCRHAPTAQRVTTSNRTTYIDGTYDEPHDVTSC